MYFGNCKSKAKWQKTFIDNVFGRKSKYSNSFSKIVLNNTALLDGKNDHIPKSLFKFYKPTSESIIDIKQRRLWFSHPQAFNDPFDSHTGYDTESYEKHAFMEYINKHAHVEPENSKDGFTVDEFNRLSASTTEYDYYYSKKPEEYHTLFRKLLEDKSETFNRKIHDVIRQVREEVTSKMARLRNAKIRIACFSAYTGSDIFIDIREAL